MGSAPQTIRCGHPCRHRDSARDGQDILDLKQAKPITRHHKQPLGAGSECAQAARAVLRTVSGHMIAPPGGSIKADEDRPSNSAAGDVRLRRALEVRSRIQAARTQGFSLPASESRWPTFSGTPPSRQAGVRAGQVNDSRSSPVGPAIGGPVTRPKDRANRRAGRVSRLGPGNGPSPR